MNGSQTVMAEFNSPVSTSDNAFQASLLEGVSRTFALTIPQLPANLYEPVANAYLLCRIVDTIEDEVSLDVYQKKTFCSRFIEITQTGQGAEAFSDDLAPLLSKQTLPAEHELIQVTPRVIHITHRFDPVQIDALATCVKTMAEGMPVFQASDLSEGLPTLADMDSYCYYVAGCVGEMLAKLFCHYSPEIAAHKEKLLDLSVSFGQGLQMTNILKDIWDDAQRGVCWLPQDIFTETGFDLATLTPATDDENFRTGLVHLISIAQGHLQNALTYTQLIPAHETGIRNFCLWALGMSVLTLRKIKMNLDFKNSNQVKISRDSVKATIAATRLAGRSNLLLSWLFNQASRNLKTPGWTYSPPSLKA
ncbi:MAG: phytoene synthase [Gammaproteobacteria bacterium HGW-Gammaproteobacteria-3]|nr:MAG: phytoene synthase [Gammaproteobacteria bacterium HGW-Gammaproteobacteria-3]